MARPKKAGRPTKLTDEIKIALLNLTKEGKTVLQLSEIFGVCEKTLYNWVNADKPFLQSLKEARASGADENVERSLLERATGYSHKAVKLFYDKDRGEVVEHEFVQHYPPDPTSMIFWLKNRQPDKWRDKQELDFSAKEIKIEISKDDEKL